jgi:hypothetical protein
VSPWQCVAESLAHAQAHGSISHVTESDHYRTACYVTLEIANLLRQATGGVERHINCGAALASNVGGYIDAGILFVRVCGRGGNVLAYPASRPGRVRG